MNNNNLKLLICCMIVIAVGFSEFGYSASAASAAQASEPVGKEDPFEMVVPIADAKKSIIQKLIGSNEQEVAVVVEAPELFVEAIMLKFLQASNLELVVTSLTSSYGAVSTDAETNTLLIVDSRERLDMIVEQIRKADQTPKQILIDVVIVDVQLNDETEVGVDWTDLLGDSDSDNDIGIPGVPLGTHNNSFSQGLIPDSLGGATLHILRDNIGVTLQALQQIRNVEILANPKLLVVSGQEATIKTVEEIPYREQSETSAGGDMTSTEFKEAGITL
ncbi:MAG: hypothetical protein KAR47_19545, partial [Planctomycetes bacterium]|nr:hypothetical protein [Planctomycetota bacterium]